MLHHTAPVLLSLGHGYSAQALTRLLLPLGWRVIGTTRTAAQAERLARTGVEPLIWPQSLPHPLPESPPQSPPGPLTDALACATCILSSIAPDEGGDPVLARHRAEIARAPAVWVGYLSSTAVYGDHGGAWVDEETPLAPTSARAVQRVLAERQWQSLGLPLHIFRLAGIYGPGRGPFEKVRDGTARRIIKPGQVFSRVHVNDIAATLFASMGQPAPGTIYNVCDNDPAPPQDVLSHAAHLLGLPDLPEVDYRTADMSPMARSFYADNKRVRNDRLQALGVTLAYPTYREGLAALLENDTGTQ